MLLTGVLIINTIFALVSLDRYNTLQRIYKPSTCILYTQLVIRAFIELDYQYVLYYL